MSEKKIARYMKPDGGILEVEYDPATPCFCCGRPVVAASMGGTAICPWCDCGTHRDGTPWTIEDAEEMGKNYRAALAKAKGE